MYNYDFIDSIKKENIIINTNESNIDTMILPELKEILIPKLCKIFPERNENEVFLSLTYPEDGSPMMDYYRFFESPQIVAERFDEFKGVFLVELRSQQDSMINKFVDYANYKSNDDFRFIIVKKSDISIELKNSSEYSLYIDMKQYKKELTKTQYKIITKKYKEYPELQNMDIENFNKFIYKFKQNNDIRSSLTVVNESNKLKRIGF